MFASRPDAFDSRPFKIFISLLDKWEIGQHIADLMIIDVLKALRRCATAVQQDGNGEDISMTAGTVTEALEPHILWKQLFFIVHKEIGANVKLLEAIPLVRFVVASLRTEDEEVDCVHLPVLFTALLGYIKVSHTVYFVRTLTGQCRHLSRSSPLVQALKLLVALSNFSSTSSRGFLLTRGPHLHHASSRIATWMAVRHMREHVHFTRSTRTTAWTLSPCPTAQPWCPHLRI